MSAIPRLTPCAAMLLAVVALMAEPLPAPCADATKRFPFFEPIDPPRPVQVIAHRGMACSAPENTRKAIEMCIADGYEWAEIDVRLSKDGKYVLFHDERLDGKTDGSGAVADKTLEELQSLDAGAWFARRYAGTRLLTLAEALSLAKGKINLYLDCKRVEPELLVKEILAAEMAGQVVVYGEPPLIGRIREASNRKVAVMTKWRPANGMPINEWLDRTKPDVVEIDAGDVSADVCRAFHDRGVRVEAKVLGDQLDRETTWAKTVAAGADWLQTDYPTEILARNMRERCPKRPVLISLHRGANRYAPENTLPSTVRASRIGADYIELDIRTTKDGKFVLMHDSTVNRTTDGRGRVRDLTFAEIEKLDAGKWFGQPYLGTKVPTLEEYFGALGDRAHAYLDAKDIAPEELAALMVKYNLLDRSVVYQSADYLRKLKKIQPTARALPPLKNIRDLDALADLQPYGVDAEWTALSKELIDRCHQRGIKVFSDALGSHETIDNYRQAIGWGIDVIQTDHPARVIRAVELVGERK